jgi:hypothetical protein
MTFAEEPIVRLILEANLCPRPARSNGLPHAGEHDLVNPASGPLAYAREGRRG